MTEFVHSSVLTELSAAENRLVAWLSRPRGVAVACVVTLTAAGWLALALMAARDGVWVALCRGDAPATLLEFMLVPVMWSAMVLAMMLPTAGPMILTYAEIADTGVRKGEVVVSPLVLAAGYLTVWLGFALMASAAQFAIARTPHAEAAGPAMAGVLLMAAGAYQFSALKHACLSACQRPFPFFFANWTEAPAGVFRLGLRQGLYCLGCCWAMMLLMLATGAMNIVWMAALGAVMTVEKMTSTPRFARALGVAFIAAGLASLISGLL